jgi:hypothetical protein
MQWSAIFNKRKNNSEDCEEKQGKKSARRNQSDPHVCHLCGGILARGTNSYKEHHWNQRHQDEKNTKFQTLIVPKNHIKGQGLLKHNDVRPTEDEADNVPLNEDLTCNDIYIYVNTTTSPNANDSGDDDNADNLEDCDARSQFSQNSPTPSVDTQPTASGAQKIIRTTANSFFKACESEKTGQSSLDTIENYCETG